MIRHAQNSFKILDIEPRWLADIKRDERLDAARPLKPPGRCSGCWPHDGEVDGRAVDIFV